MSARNQAACMLVCQAPTCQWRTALSLKNAREVSRVIDSLPVWDENGGFVVVSGNTRLQRFCRGLDGLSLK